MNLRDIRESYFKLIDYLRLLLLLNNLVNKLILNVY